MLLCVANEYCIISHQLNIHHFKYHPNISFYPMTSQCPCKMPGFRHRSKAARRPSLSTPRRGGSHPGLGGVRHGRSAAQLGPWWMGKSGRNGLNMICGLDIYDIYLCHFYVYRYHDVSLSIYIYVINYIIYIYNSHVMYENHLKSINIWKRLRKPRLIMTDGLHTVSFWTLDCAPLIGKASL